VQEEQVPSATILDGAGKAGSRAAVGFDDPDAVIVVETIGGDTGMSPWFREDLQRRPTLHID
jgi:hypothetical protein